MILVVDAIGTCSSGSLPARYRPESASMSAHELASSFGAPGGAPVSWAETPGARISKTENAIRVAALLTRSILARTRCSPLPLIAGQEPPGPLPLQRCRRRRRTRVFCTTGPSLTTSGEIYLGRTVAAAVGRR